MTDDARRPARARARARRASCPRTKACCCTAYARERLPHGPVLEVGTYCGKSAIYLGAAAREVGGTVFTVDHHRGSEENQAGWEHHDPTLVDAEFGLMDTLPVFRTHHRPRRSRGPGRRGRRPVHDRRARTGARPLSLLFIDGGHAEEHAHNDYAGWAPWVMPGGLLVIHDVFPDPADGGRPPYDIYLRALDERRLRRGRGARARCGCCAGRAATPAPTAASADGQPHSSADRGEVRRQRRAAHDVRARACPCAEGVRRRG